MAIKPGELLKLKFKQGKCLSSRKAVLDKECVQDRLQLEGGQEEKQRFWGLYVLTATFVCV